MPPPPKPAPNRLLYRRQNIATSTGTRKTELSGSDPNLKSSTELHLKAVNAAQLRLAKTNVKGSYSNLAIGTNSTYLPNATFNTTQSGKPRSNGGRIGDHLNRTVKNQEVCKITHLYTYYAK